MNMAHLHLMVVHIPVILVPLGLVLLLIALKRDGGPIQLVAFNIFIVAAVFAGIAFLVGEEAEDIVENLAGVVESTIEAHEDSALIALWLTVALGAFSLLSVIANRFKPRFAPVLVLPVLVLSLLSSGALAYTAQQGGKIRHPEAFEAQRVGPEVSSSERHEKDGDET